MSSFTGKCGYEQSQGTDVLTSVLTLRAGAKSVFVSELQITLGSLTDSREKQVYEKIARMFRKSISSVIAREFRLCPFLSN